MRIALHTRSPQDPAVGNDGPIAGAARPAARFGRHVLEMCVVMCVSLGLLGLLVFAATAVLEVSDVREEAPELSAGVVATVLAGSMVVWMRFRGMAWRSTLEMATPALVAGAVMVAGYWVGIVAQRDLIGSVCGVACLGMIAVMPRTGTAPRSMTGTCSASTLLTSRWRHPTPRAQGRRGTTVPALRTSDGLAIGAVRRGLGLGCQGPSPYPTRVSIW
jgi:hypothetical protein